MISPETSSTDNFQQSFLLLADIALNHGVSKAFREDLEEREAKFQTPDGVEHWVTLNGERAIGAGMLMLAFYGKFQDGYSSSYYLNRDGTIYHEKIHEATFWSDDSDDTSIQRTEDLSLSNRADLLEDLKSLHSSLA